MRSGRRLGSNPFYTLLMIVSTLFVVTILGYLIGPYAEQRVIEGKAAPSPLAAWFERKGVVALGIEFAVMTVLAVLAMATEDYFAGERKG